MKKIFSIGLLFLMAACAPPTHYVWGNYEYSLYHYYQNPADPQPYVAALKSAVTRGDAIGKTAPGLHAEYGYMLISLHHPRQAVQQFEDEKRLWPESAGLMDRMIASMAGPSGTPGAKPQS